MAIPNSSFVYGERASGILYNYLHGLPGDKNGTWVIPANCCTVVPLTLLKAGKKVITVDINPATLCLDLEKTNDLSNSNDIEGVLFIETYGSGIYDKTAIEALKTSKPEIRIVLDRCLSQPDFAVPRETFPDLVLYSTGRAKQVDIGYGGFAYSFISSTTTAEMLPYNSNDEKKTEEYSKEMMPQSFPYKYQDTNWLDNRTLSIPAAEYQNKVMNELNGQHSLKEQISGIYAELLPEHIQLKKQFQQWRFNILVKEKDLLLNEIFTAGLFASSHYAPLSSLALNTSQSNAQKLYYSIINLFTDKYFTVEKAEKICELITRHCEKHPLEDHVIQHFNQALTQ